MILKRILGNKLLLDTNSENEVYNKEHIIYATNEVQINFTYRELTELADAEPKFGINLITSILKSFPGIKKIESIPSIFIYKNSDELPIYIKQHGDYYLILAIGEFQYGRYKIILEGVLKKEPTQPSNL